MKLTDLGLCKKVDESISASSSAGTAVRTVDEHTPNIHVEEATRLQSEEAAAVTVAGISATALPSNATVVEASDSAVAPSSGEPVAHAGADSTQRPHHRDRALAYSTVGTPDYIAPEVCVHVCACCGLQLYIFFML